MLILYNIRQFFQSMAYQELSPSTLALSFCIGSYIAFSPFIFLHTVMVFIFGWLFKLNIPVTFAASCGINNPWTAVPIYVIDYVFGYWMVHSVGKMELSNPSWMCWIENFIQNTLHLSKPCLWSFLIGGNLLGIIVSIVLYPVMKKIFTLLMKEKSLPTHGI